jgi:hypothetical protein
MKATTIILFEMLFFVILANAQHVLLVPTIEKAVGGNQYGSQLLFEAKNKWSFGGFYQTSLQLHPDGGQTLNAFYGFAINAPLVKSDKINFYFNVRGGVVNRQFLVVVPGLETKLKISKRLGVSALMSVRMTYPSASLKIYITL